MRHAKRSTQRACCTMILPVYMASSPSNRALQGVVEVFYEFLLNLLDEL